MTDEVHFHLGVKQYAMCRASKYTLLPVFCVVNTGVRNYHKIYGISSINHGKFMACFFIIPMEKQAINFSKNCDHESILPAHLKDCVLSFLFVP